MKKTTLLLAIIIAVLLLLGTLLLFPKKYETGNNFQRVYPNTLLHKARVIEWSSDVDLLMAWKGNIIAHSLSSKYISLIDTAGKILSSLQFTALTPRSSIHSIDVDSGSVYFFDLNDRIALKSDFKQGLSVSDPLQKGLRGIVKSTGGYVCLQLDSLNKNVSLNKMNTGSVVQQLYHLEPYDDWGFSHLGLMFKNEVGSKVFYMPFYNSRIIEYDQQLSAVSFITSIDKSPVKDYSIATGEGRALSSKAPKINRKGCADNRCLYVLSYAGSKDDPEDNEIIDVYDINTGKYLHSFVLPDFKKEEVNALTCTGGKLIAGYKNNIIIYDIP
jgi:hypothetical protein